MYRKTFLANEDWKTSQKAYVHNFMQNQVKYKEAQKEINTSGDPMLESSPLKKLGKFRTKSVPSDTAATAKSVNTF